MVEFLTRDRGVAGSSLTATGLPSLCPWARHINPCFCNPCYWFNPRRLVLTLQKKLLTGTKRNKINQTCTNTSIACTDPERGQGVPVAPWKITSSIGFQLSIGISNWTPLPPGKKIGPSWKMLDPLGKPHWTPWGLIIIKHTLFPLFMWGCDIKILPVG